MNTETWSAQQIGRSFGAYSGRTVSFIFDDAKVTGRLDRSDGSLTTYVMLVVDGTSFFVSPTTTVEVS